MEYLGRTITNPAITKNPKDSRVYAINKKGESFTAVSVSVDAAMRKIIIMGHMVSDCCAAREPSSRQGEPLFDRDKGICSDCWAHCNFIPAAEYL